MTYGYLLSSKSSKENVKWYDSLSRRHLQSDPLDPLLLNIFLIKWLTHFLFFIFSLFFLFVLFGFKGLAITSYFSFNLVIICSTKFKYDTRTHKGRWGAVASVCTNTLWTTHLDNQLPASFPLHLMQHMLGVACFHTCT